MNRLDAFDRILASLHPAALDDAHWPATAALIDEACGTTGNALVVAEGSASDARVYFARYLYRGESRPDLAREYFDVYYPHDEGPPRLRERPAGQVVHVPDLYTEAELRTSPANNESWRRREVQNGLIMRLDRLDDLRIVWAIGDPPGKRRLAVRSTPTDRVSVAAYPPVHLRPSGAGWRRCAERQSRGCCWSGSRSGRRRRRAYVRGWSWAAGGTVAATWTGWARRSAAASRWRTSGWGWSWPEQGGTCWRTRPRASRNGARALRCGQARA